MEESAPSREELLSELAALRARVATLQSSTGNFRAMADSANEGIVVFLGGTRVYYNPRWLEITGYDAAAYEDSPFLARVHGDDRERVAASFDRLLAGEPPTADLRLRLINRAGDTRHLAAKMSRIQWHGQPAGMVLVEDVTERQRTQDALRESERHFAAAFENSPIPMSIVDTESGERKAANKRFLNVMGYSEAEYVGSNFFTQAYSIDRTRQQYAARRIRHDGYVFAYPLELRTKSGEIRSMLLNASLLNPQENALAIVAYMDVTERKQTEQALLESETLYRSVVSAMREGLVVQDTTDKILMANQSAANILGLTREQLLGRDSYDPRWQAYHLDGTPFNPNDHPSIVSLRTGRAVDNTPMDVHIGDGRRAIISINARPIANAAGAISGAVATFTDVTRQVEAERAQRRLTQQLEQQAQQLQRVMDSVPEGLLLIAGDGRILLANPTAQGDLARLAHGAAVGDRLRQLGDLPLAALLARPTNGLWHQLVYQNRAFELLAKPLSGNSETNGWVLLIRDVTMEKEIQQRVQQQERLAAVGQLAAGIAHDFNNILAVVTLYTDLSLLDHSLPANILQRFETIKKQAERATDLTRQILDFGRRSVMERAPLDLVSLLKEMVKLFERTLPENITLHLHHPHLPHALTVNGDVTRLQQVLMNLVVNARDAMPDGGSVWIDLQRLAGADLGDALPTDLARRLINRETSPAWARLSFRDSGPGIAPDVLPHIFEPFYTTKEQSKGTGLGLAQVFGIIKQHDGEIDVVSTAGAGSTFFIYLPLLDANTGPPGQRQPAELPLGRGETILIVEDNAPMRQVLESSLQELNYATRMAANGEEALRILRDEGDDVALVLTDLVMPAMGGKSLLAALQAAGLRHKVIAMTGHAMFAEKASILALGAVDWLNKPISLERLARVMARALGTADDTTPG